jgi:DNA primase
MEGVLRGWVARLIRPAMEHEQKVLTPPGMKSSLLLWGLDHVKTSCVLVEGVFDALAFPDGVAVASLGAKLSPIQRHLLRQRGVEKVIIMYDHDEAGKKGAKRAARELVAAGFETWIAVLPEGIDPGSSDMLQLGRAIQGAFPVEGVKSMKEIERQFSNKETNHA